MCQAAALGPRAVCGAVCGGLATGSARTVTGHYRRPVALGCLQRLGGIDLCRHMKILHKVPTVAYKTKARDTRQKEQHTKQK